MNENYCALEPWEPVGRSLNGIWKNGIDVNTGMVSNTMANLKPNDPTV